MSTVATSPTTETNHVEALAAAIASVAKRLRIQDFDVIGIEAHWSRTRRMPVVQVHVAERTHALAVYFNLRDLTTNGDCAMYQAEQIVGHPGILVGVFGPA